MDLLERDYGSAPLEEALAGTGGGEEGAGQGGALKPAS
jgi:hypothetical protein